YTWDFGDGSPGAAGARVSHIYAEGGVYPVVLTVDDGTGLSNGRARH
ncbi:MAG TPA: PKD domain-containing protein, partial [Patescibacteria group bacterium]|nr:PKD domain-containing protein [Patescibacteria group bacterium]